jgi:hypothetical protein
MTIKNKYLIIIRHFETHKNSEKIKFNESFAKSQLFINYITKFVKKYSDIKKIKFYTTNYERTITTSLILSSNLKNEIINNTLSNLQIFEPEINNILDRDPKKIKKDDTCKNFKNNIEKNMDDDTLYIYITHSSVIYNLFECIINMVANKKFNNPVKRIYNYSISSLVKYNDKIKYNFNKKIS